jgi:hypothetical protein
MDWEIWARFSSSHAQAFGVLRFAQRFRVDRPRQFDSISRHTENKKLADGQVPIISRIRGYQYPLSKRYPSRGSFVESIPFPFLIKFFQRRRPPCRSSPPRSAEKFSSISKSISRPSKWGEKVKGRSSIKSKPAFHKANSESAWLASSPHPIGGPSKNNSVSSGRARVIELEKSCHIKFGR